MFKNLKISIKLHAGFGLIILLIVLMFAINNYNLTKIQNSSSNTKNQLYPIMKKSNELIIYTIGLQKWFAELASARNMGVYAESIVESEIKLEEFNTKINELIKIDAVNTAQLNNLREPYDEYFSIGLKMVQAYSLNNEELV